MEETWMECKICKDAPAEQKESAKMCRLCGALHCDECINEAGYCTPCSEKMGYSMEEASPV